MTFGRSAAIIGSLALLASCSGLSGTVPTATPNRLPKVRVKLVRIAGIRQPTAMAARPGDDALYVAEKAGRVWAIDAPGRRRLALDLSTKVTDTRRLQRFNEQGLLGLTFSPDGTYLYADYTDAIGDTRVSAIPFDPVRMQTADAQDILRVPQRSPDRSHNGGAIVFGPDGYLYIGIGDGGGTHGMYAQRLGTMLGKILRIDPRPGSDPPYRVPADNPFLSTKGARPEIFSYGLRNPWRFSFDRLTGDLWIADVGENRWEEIDFRPARRAGGENFGWNIYEAGVPFASELKADISRRLNRAGRVVFPIYAYPHPHPGCAANVGGFVYRGTRIPQLSGTYVFGDLCDGKIQALWTRNGTVLGQRVIGRARLALGFGQDHRGELYVLTLNNGVFRLDRTRR